MKKETRTMIAAAVVVGLFAWLARLLGSSSPVPPRPIGPGRPVGPTGPTTPSGPVVATLDELRTQSRAAQARYGEFRDARRRAIGDGNEAAAAQADVNMLAWHERYLELEREITRRGG